MTPVLLPPLLLLHACDCSCFCWSWWAFGAAEPAGSVKLSSTMTPVLMPSLPLLLHACDCICCCWSCWTTGVTELVDCSCCWVLKAPGAVVPVGIDDMLSSVRPVLSTALLLQASDWSCCSWWCLATGTVELVSTDELDAFSAPIMPILSPSPLPLPPTFGCRCCFFSFFFCSLTPTSGATVCSSLFLFIVRSYLECNNTKQILKYICLLLWQKKSWWWIITMNLYLNNMLNIITTLKILFELKKTWIKSSFIM